VCISPGAPMAPPPTPPPPPAPEKTAQTVEQPAVTRQAELLASRLGTSSLAIPFTPIQVPR
jgi:hypothetical protein